MRTKHQEGAYVTSSGVTVHLGQGKPIDVECVVTLDDGTKMEVQTVVREAYANWNDILLKLGLNY